MFRTNLINELERHIGSSVEIALDDRLIEGILLSAAGDLVIVSDTSGYNPGVEVNINFQFINSIRFPQTV
ncbi:hypothetical protein M3225_27320 [Priestia aryabhattai]|uniref:hypothetical protein n=1 Tax=Priestia aryabhattai TaxID=412384 RepID=UPI00203D862C|nr:hypothetical protein [Priestia aryabhattai]MCM3774129.1 hypothetical protein [Priestia aryabhattai]